MVFISNRKFKLLKAGVFGGFLVLLPSLLIFSYIVSQVRKENSAEADSEGTEYVNVYLLNKSLSANDRIEKNDYYAYLMPKEYASEGILSEDEVLGKYVKLPLSKNSMIIKDLITDKVLTDDLRLHNFNFIKMNNKLQPGDFIDIRISFADGTDYILLTKKEIIDLTRYNPDMSDEDSIWLEVSEEEILRLSSGAVDVYLKEGCSIYAIKYLESVQEALIMNYPVNDAVMELIMSDPNIENLATAYLNSKIREQNPIAGDKWKGVGEQSNENFHIDGSEKTEIGDNNIIEYLD